MTTERQDKLDYDYIDKLKGKSERQLKTMLDSLGKQKTKLMTEQTKLQNRINDKIKKEHFIKDALMEKWRTPSKEFLEAIKEVQSGQTTTYNSVDEMMRDLQQ